MSRASMPLNKPMSEYPIVVSEGNPGAATVILAISKQLNEEVPSWCKGRVWNEPLWYLMVLDDMGIRGPLLWILYKDVCGRSTLQTMAVIIAAQHAPDILSKEDDDWLYNFLTALSVDYAETIKRKPDTEDVLKAVERKWK